MLWSPSLNATYVAIETSGQVGVRSSPVRAKVKVRARRKKINFRGLNASIFLIFSLNTPKILRGVHFFALEHPKMKYGTYNGESYSEYEYREGCQSQRAV